LLGLVRHLTNMEVSRLRWFAGDKVEMPYGRDDFEGVAEADASENLKRWRKECRRGDEIIASAPNLDDPGANGLSLRVVILSLSNEYARHNGHADLLRERIDGTSGV
jgi:hypothetical protein